jgi:hypothetical protein
MVIQKLQQQRHPVQKSFPKWADVNIVLSGLFENPRGCKGKRVLFFDKNEWQPRGRGWDTLYGDIVKHYYDEIIDVTEKTFSETAQAVIDYIHAEERKADKS